MQEQGNSMTPEDKAICASYFNSAAQTAESHELRPDSRPPTDSEWTALGYSPMTADEEDAWLKEKMDLRRSAISRSTFEPTVDGDPYDFGYHSDSDDDTVGRTGRRDSTYGLKRRSAALSASGFNPHTSISASSRRSARSLPSQYDTYNDSNY
jgi:hypothetical protein